MTVAKTFIFHYCFVTIKSLLLLFHYCFHCNVSSLVFSTLHNFVMYIKKNSFGATLCTILYHIMGNLQVIKISDMTEIWYFMNLGCQYY